MKYLQLQSTDKLPDISELGPFRCIVVIEVDVTQEWQSQVSTCLVTSGGLYMLAWGMSCSSWG